MSVRISPNLPANVVEIGQELAQATLDGINNSESPSAGNPMITQSALTSQIGGFITDAPSDSSLKARYNGTWTSFNDFQEAPTDGQQYARQNSGWSVVSGGGGSWNGGTITNPIIVQDAYNTSQIGTSSISVHTDGYGLVYLQQGGVQFGDGTFQSTAYAGVDYKKNIANIAMSCFQSNNINSYFWFNGSIAMSVIMSGKFTSSIATEQLGFGTSGTTPTPFTLSSTNDAFGNTYATCTIPWGSMYGVSIAYSNDTGSTWTYSDFSL